MNTNEWTSLRERQEMDYLDSMFKDLMKQQEKERLEKIKKDHLEKERLEKERMEQEEKDEPKPSISELRRLRILRIEQSFMKK